MSRRDIEEVVAEELARGVLVNVVASNGGLIDQVRLAAVPAPGVLVSTPHRDYKAVGKVYLRGTRDYPAMPAVELVGE